MKFVKGLLFFLGCAMCVVGAAILHPGLGWIVGGIGVVGYSLLLGKTVEL